MKRRQSVKSVQRQVEAAFRSYTPIILQQRLISKLTQASSTKEEEALLPPCSDNVHGTLVIADISGFTALSSHLSSAETLKEVINDFFSRLIKVIESFKGDVIRFCGDSMLILFQVPSDKVENEDFKVASAITACLCALQLVETCGSYNFETFPLSIHCGISYGEMHLLILGDPKGPLFSTSERNFQSSTERYEYLLTGTTIIKAGEAQAAAKLKQICLTQEMFKFVNEILECITLPDSENLLFQLTGRLSKSYKGNIITNTFEKIQVKREGSGEYEATTTTTSSSKSSDKISDVNRFTMNEAGNSLASSCSDTYTDNQHKPDNDIVEQDHNQLGLSVAELMENNFNFGNRIYLDEMSKFLQYELQLITNSSLMKSLTAVLRPFIDTCARNAVELSTSTLLSEMRFVATIFLHINGLEESFANGHCQLPQEVFLSLLSCLRNHGGHLRQFVQDDKGCIFIACFGLTGSTHGDDCIRAVDASLNMISVLKKLDIVVSCGISYGNVYCGIVGGNDRGEYTVMGNKVNLAARLMACCEKGTISHENCINRILVESDVFQQAKCSFKWLKLPSVVAKGYPAPIEIYTPVCKLTNSSSTPNSGAVVLSWLDYVDPVDISILKVASLLGQTFSIELFKRALIKAGLKKVTKGNRLSLKIYNLVSAGFFHQSIEGYISFCDEAVKSALHASMLESQRGIVEDILAHTYIRPQNIADAKASSSLHLRIFNTIRNFFSRKKGKSNKIYSSISLQGI